jgi:hypothetical protein
MRRVLSFTVFIAYLWESSCVTFYSWKMKVIQLLLPALGSTRRGLTNLWYSCPKWQGERFPLAGGTNCCPKFCISFAQFLYSVNHMCVCVCVCVYIYIYIYIFI